MIDLWSRRYRLQADQAPNADALALEMRRAASTINQVGRIARGEMDMRFEGPNQPTAPLTGVAPYEQLAAYHKHIAANSTNNATDSIEVDNVTAYRSDTSFGIMYLGALFPLTNIPGHGDVAPGGTTYPARAFRLQFRFRSSNGGFTREVWHKSVAAGSLTRFVIVRPNMQDPTANLDQGIHLFTPADNCGPATQGKRVIEAGTYYTATAVIANNHNSGALYNNSIQIRIGTQVFGAAVTVPQTDAVKLTVTLLEVIT